MEIKYKVKYDLEERNVNKAREKSTSKESERKVEMENNLILRFLSGGLLNDFIKQCAHKERWREMLYKERPLSQNKKKERERSKNAHTKH